ncbi:MAG: protein kinase [Proteobacteria bacterium]|nr:protein kinase [Pseudomonadota bacterium]MCH8976410.1 protein kinase [Pseudomonadota bacterium]
MLNILVIDDSSDYRALLKQLIVSNYPHVQIEEYDPDVNGIPEKSRNWKAYSMVLLDYDLGLENENGLDWLQIMMTYPDMPPIVILTSETSTTITVRALKLGAANYLLKTDINSDNIISNLTESFELVGLNQKSSMSTSEHGGKFNDDAIFDLTAMPDLENMLTEETLAPDFVDIPDDNDPHINIPGYSIRKEIAKGGMSTVLLAKRLEDDLDVVLKVLYTKGLEDSSGLKRFIQEYDLLSAMNHPHIIRIYERAFASEFAYIALEYLPQGDLSKRISEGISTETAMSYLRQIALGLGAIHKLNIIHRDLKPGNILFHDDGTLTITDFGTAKIISDKMMDITMKNMVVGTPHYMSPEQCTGKKIDRRSDIYSLGVLFYQMLTAKMLFTANSITKLIQSHINDPIPALPANLSKYQPLIEGMLAKDPDERFQTVDELIAGIDWIEQSEE